MYADIASAACPAQPRQSGDDIHDFCSCHLWCLWSLFSEYCIRPRIVFTISPQSTTRPLYFWCFASNSAFFKWQMSINEAKWTVAPDILASSITCFSLLTFVKFHAEIFSNFSHSLSTASPSMKQSEPYCCFSVSLLWPPFCSWLFSHPMLELSRACSIPQPLLPLHLESSSHAA